MIVLIAIRYPDLNATNIEIKVIVFLRNCYSGVAFDGGARQTGPLNSLHRVPRSGRQVPRQIAPDRDGPSAVHPESQIAAMSDVMKVAYDYVTAPDAEISAFERGVATRRKRIAPKTWTPESVKS